MRTIYIDSDFVCHAEQAEGLRPIETDFFDEKCPEYISGFRLIPDGEQWVHPDGRVFHGFQIFSWKPYDQLMHIQRAVDAAEAKVNDERDKELAALIEEIYQEDLAMMED